MKLEIDVRFNICRNLGETPRHEVFFEIFPTELKFLFYDLIQPLNTYLSKWIEYELTTIHTCCKYLFFAIPILICTYVCMCQSYIFTYLYITDNIHV